MTQLVEQGTAQEVRERVEDGLREARAGVTRADRQLKRLVREKPLATSIAALAGGFLLGRLLSRR